jgi:predicted permease
MKWFNIVIARLRGLLGREAVLHDIDEELRSHLEMETETNIKKGMEPEEARRTALRSFGNTGRIRDIAYEVRGGGVLETIWQDIRYGVRMMLRNPGFTIVAVLSLALGIGANTSIFTLLNAVVLRTLPVNDPDRLVKPSFVGPGYENRNFSYPFYERLRDGNHTLSGLIAFSRMRRLNVGVKGKSELASGELVTGNYFSVLGVNPLHGRLFTAEDERQRAAVAVISYGFWQRRFGGESAAIGATVTLNQKPFSIIAVAPPRFSGLTLGVSPDIWLPLRLLDQLDVGPRPWDKPFNVWLVVMGRLKPGVTIDQAKADLDSINRQFLTELAVTSPPMERRASERMSREAHINLESGATGHGGRLRWEYEYPLKILMAFVGLVLLVACANIATLLLARAAARQREIAVRLAIGAGRGRIIRQLLTESFLLSALGGALGLLIALVESRALMAMVSDGDAIEVSPNLRVFIFTAASSLLTAFIFGLAPALRASRVSPFTAMKEHPGHTALARGRLDKVLIVFQVAISVLLLAGAGLFVRSLNNLWNVDTGYDRENVLMFSLNPRLTGYQVEQLPQLYRLLLERVESTPGVTSASLSFVRPIDDEAYFATILDGIGDQRFEPDKAISVAWNAISPGYFTTLGTPMLLGREFRIEDNETAPKVAIINETMALRYFPNQNPIGNRVISTPDNLDLEIVGVAKDSRYGNLKDAPPNVLYRPIFQSKLSFSSVTFEARYTGATSTMASQLRKQVEEVDRNLPLFRVKTLVVQAQESLRQERLVATLSSSFALLALLLAGIGLYGLLSYRVASRTGEIGIRMALGAQRKDVLWLVVREGLLLVIAGIALGVPLTLAVTRYLRGMLFGLSPQDPTALMAAVFLLVSVATLASLLPARRASRLDPMLALRL